MPLRLFTLLQLPGNALLSSILYHVAEQALAGRVLGDARKLLVQRGIQVVVSGGPGDAVHAADIATAISGNAVSLAGEMELNDLGALLQQAVCLVSVDSAPMHMAVALKTPVVALFGPTDPERTGPVSEKAEVLTGECPSRGCRRRRCRRKGSCMESIRPEIVLEATLRLTGNQSQK